MRFTFRVVCMLAGIIFFSVYLNTLLSAYSFQKTYKEMVASRFAVVGATIKRSVDYGLGIGLDLESMNTLQTVIERMRQDTPEILAIAIVNEQGDAVFHTDHSLIGKPVLRDWLYGLPFPKGAVWRHETGDGMAFSLYNNFDVYVGALDVTYDRTAMDALFTQTDSQFRVAGVLVTAGGLLLAFFAISLIARRMQSSLLWFSTSLDRLIEKQQPVDGNPPEGVLFSEGFSVYCHESAALVAGDSTSAACDKAAPEE